MLTRSKANYSGIAMKDFVALQPLQSTFRRRKTYKPVQTIKAVQHKNTKNVLGNILLFDIESYEINVKDPISDIITKKWIPYQIAWGIYSSNDMKSITKKNYYVSELWVNPTYRRNISDMYRDSFKKNLSRVKSSDYSMKSSHSIVNKMLETIQRYDVRTIASYNIHSDFSTLKDLVTYIPSRTKIDTRLFNCKYTNPFRIQGVNYCDLMHNAAILYMDYLIKEGLEDEKIFRNAKTKKIKLTGRNNSKSIYSAEYILKKFFNDKQPHTANGDVKLEMKMLKKMVEDFGQKELELNVMYPENLYHQFERKIINEHSQEVKTAFLYGQKQSKSTQSTQITQPVVSKETALQNAKQFKKDPSQNNANNNVKE